MMQGDQYGLPIELLKDNGSPLTESDVDDVEIYIGSIRKTLKSKTVIFDETDQTFVVKLTQNDTFLLNRSIIIQVRILFKNGDVIGIDLGTYNIENAISKVVLK